MKRVLPAIILSAILLTGCYDDDCKNPDTIAVSEIQTEPESAEEESTATAVNIKELAQSFTEPLESTEPSDTPEPSEVIPETIEADSTEPTTEPEIPTETTTTEPTETEPTESAETEPAETEQTAETAISEPTAEPPITTEPTTENAAEPLIEPPTEPVQTDYEKALAVYEYIRENGYGTCVQYSSQTYVKCQEIGLPCWFVWTDAGIYGHVANTVCVDGIWFIMDTQAGRFLTFNPGFTEVVDMEMNHIGDAEMISHYSYEELFG